MAVEDVWPRIDAGTVPIRRVPGETVEVFADIFADGVSGVRGVVRWRGPGARGWNSAPMEPIGNDRWRGAFPVSTPGEYLYRVEGWVDPFLTWRTMLERRVLARSVLARDLIEGAELLRSAGRRLRGPLRASLLARADTLEETVAHSVDEAVKIALDPQVESAAAVPPPSRSFGRSPVTYRVTVDPPRAQHSAWYELFPRSTSTTPGRPGTLRDLRGRLRYVADLGFDVVYLPPVHPIGRSRRRGPNNQPRTPTGALGSPWAIGSDEGGHMSVDPGLGTLEEFRETVRAAHDLGLEVALDLAFQCSPDHPWVREHPTWFRRLPDGTIRAAENPPKLYDDIYPIDFETPDWRALWRTLEEVVEFWVGQGVRWFRVDNPHTKPFEFWRWLIGEVRRRHPDVLFLAEAFTRPKVMYRLGKVGFTHSYTYFAWRTRKHELETYFTELSSGALAEYFRPHLWPNTPDILTEQFHRGQRAVFLTRLVLAATLSSHYGIYGPAYELMEHVPLDPGREEYRNSEKYEARLWSLDAPQSLAPQLRQINRIRRAHPALRSGRRLVFHPIDNDALIAYSRRTDDGSDVLLVIVNLDPDAAQAGWTALDLRELGLEPTEPFEVRDLLADRTYRWQGPRNFVRLEPDRLPAHILQILRSAPRAAGAP